MIDSEQTVVAGARRRPTRDCGDGLRDRSSGATATFGVLPWLGPRMPRTILLSLLALAAAALLPPATADAAARQTMSFEAPRDLRDPATRDAALDEIAG